MQVDEKALADLFKGYAKVLHFASYKLGEIPYAQIEMLAEIDANRFVAALYAAPAPVAEGGQEERERCAKLLEARASGYRERAAMPGIPQEMAEQRVYGAEVCEHAAEAIRALDAPPAPAATGGEKE